MNKARLVALIRLCAVYRTGCTGWCAGNLKGTRFDLDSQEVTTAPFHVVYK